MKLLWFLLFLPFFLGSLLWAQDPDLIKCENDEKKYQEIERTLLRSIEKAVVEKNFDAFLNLALSTFSLDPLKRNLGTPKQTKDFITEYEWEKESSGTLTQRDQQQSELLLYFNQFQSIEDFRLETFEVLIDPKDRENSVSFLRATLLVHFDLRALDTMGQRRQDRGLFQVAVQKKNGKWFLENFLLQKAQTLISSRVSFVDATTSSGLAEFSPHGKHTPLLNFADYNQDEKIDLFVSGEGHSALFKGQGQGRFTLDQQGPVQEKNIKGAVFADFFNRGHPDLLLTVTDLSKEFAFYQFKTERMEKEVLPLPLILKKKTVDVPLIPLTVGDYNGDGFLDFAVVRAEEKSPDFLFNNKKDGFQHQSFFALENIALKQSKLFPTTLLSADYDLDNDMDLFLTDGQNNGGAVFQNLSKGQFSELASRIGLSNQDLVTDTAVQALTQQNALSVLSTQLNFLSAKRLNQSCLKNWKKNYLPVAGLGLKLFNSPSPGVFEQADLLDWPGEAVQGAVFIDYNNDGLLDIFVTNGLRSGKSREEDDSGDFVSSLKKQARPQHLQDRPMAGFQRKRLYRNDGDNHFTEVAYLEGVDFPSDGRNVAVADVDNDGRMDLLLANAGPGKAHLQLLKNQHSKSNSLILTLVGSKSNRDAYGATVTATIAGKKIIRQLVGPSGKAQSQNVIHFGLADKDTVEKMTVRWPSGQTQGLGPTPKGRLTLKE